VSTTYDRNSSITGEINQRLHNPPPCTSGAQKSSPDHQPLCKASPHRLDVSGVVASCPKPRERNGTSKSSPSRGKLLSIISSGLTLFSSPPRSSSSRPVQNRAIQLIPPPEGTVGMTSRKANNYGDDLTKKAIHFYKIYDTCILICYSNAEGRLTFSNMGLSSKAAELSFTPCYKE